MPVNQVSERLRHVVIYSVFFHLEKLRIFWYTSKKHSMTMQISNDDVNESNDPVDGIYCLFFFLGSPNILKRSKFHVTAAIKAND